MVKKKYLFIPFRYRVLSGLTLDDFFSLCVYLRTVLSYHYNLIPSSLDPLYFVINMLDEISSGLLCMPVDSLNYSLSYFANISLKDGVPFYFDYPLFEVIRESISKGSTAYLVLKDVLFFKDDPSLDEEKKLALKESAFYKLVEKYAHFFDLYYYQIGKVKDYTMASVLDEYSVDQSNLGPHLSLISKSYELYGLTLTNHNLFNLVVSFLSEGYLSCVYFSSIPQEEFNSFILIYRPELKFGTADTSTFSTATSCFIPLLCSLKKFMIFFSLRFTLKCRLTV